MSRHDVQIGMKAVLASRASSRASRAELVVVLSLRSFIASLDFRVFDSILVFTCSMF